MSRRCHHGSARHLHAMRPVRPRSGVPDEPGLSNADLADAPAIEPGHHELIDDAGSSARYGAAIDAAIEGRVEREDGAPQFLSPGSSRPEPAPVRTPVAARMPAPAYRPQPRPMAPAPPAEPHVASVDDSGDHGATAPQLRRFIKSRAYVPMHELRRRFAINGGEDDMTAVEVDRGRVYVGLPEREGRLLGELLRGGDIGVELSMDPISPVVVGVYPMRPVSRG